MKTTRQQREALFKVFCRDHPSHYYAGVEYTALDLTRRRRAYRLFLKQVRPYPDGSGCIVVPWQGMLLGIETDGYVHS